LICRFSRFCFFDWCADVPFLRVAGGGGVCLVGVFFFEEGPLAGGGGTEAPRRTAALSGGGFLVLVGVGLVGGLFFEGVMGASHFLAASQQAQHMLEYAIE
jgi:hypothetical protein